MTAAGRGAPADRGHVAADAAQARRNASATPWRAAVNRANCFGDAGEFAAAEALERETISRLDQVLGPDHPDTLICRANLAVTAARGGPGPGSQGAQGEDPRRLQPGARHRPPGRRPAAGRSAHQPRPGATAVLTCPLGRCQRTRRFRDSQRKMSGSTSSAPKCAAPAWTTTAALGMRSASHMAWLTGDRLSTRAVPEQDRHRDRGRIEPPGRVERQRVVDPAVRRGPQRLGVGLQQHRRECRGRPPPGGPSRASRSCRLGQQARRISPDRDRGRGSVMAARPFVARSRPRCAPARSTAVMPSYQSSPSAPRGARPTSTAAFGQPVREQRGAGQGVRTTSGAADDGEFVQAVGVGDGQDVGGGVGDAAAFQAVGFAVARPVEGDELDAQAMQHGGPRVRSQTATRCPVQQENRLPVRDRRTPEWTAACRRGSLPDNSRSLPAVFAPFVTHGRINHRHGAGDAQRQEVPKLPVNWCSRRRGGRSRRTRGRRRCRGSGRWGGTRIWPRCPSPGRRTRPAGGSRSRSGRRGNPRR